MSKTVRDVTLVNIPVTIEYTYHCGCKGARDSMGVPMEPDDDPEVEINRVLLVTHDTSGVAVEIDVTRWVDNVSVAESF